MKLSYFLLLLLFTSLTACGLHTAIYDEPNYTTNPIPLNITKTDRINSLLLSYEIHYYTSKISNSLIGAELSGGFTAYDVICTCGKEVIIIVDNERLEFVALIDTELRWFEGVLDPIMLPISFNKLINTVNPFISVSVNGAVIDNLLVKMDFGNIMNSLIPLSSVSNILSFSYSINMDTGFLNIYFNNHSLSYEYHVIGYHNIYAPLSFFSEFMNFEVDTSDHINIIVG